jgi:hypothetical protein
LSFVGRSRQWTAFPLIFWWLLAVVAVGRMRRTPVHASLLAAAREGTETLLMVT